MASLETRRMVLAAAAACEDKKAVDTRILELDPIDSGLTDFFLITSGTNTRQVVAIADEIEFRLKREFGVYANSVEGRRVGEWVLLDYVDFVVHVFLTEKRAFYDIERLRKSAKLVDLEQLKATLNEKVKAVREKRPAKKAAQAAAKKAAAKKTAVKKVAAKKATAAVTKEKTPAKKAGKAAPAKSAARKTATKKATVAVTKSPAKKKVASKKKA
ncbi:MAG TPA: ribosome silencing factor [Acidisarcina sp.]|nr:ribosome silencing factor [Acidisarcina sp.]